MSLPVQDEVVSIDHEIAATSPPLPVPLAQETYRSLSKQDLRRIRLEGDLTEKVEVLVPADLRTPEVVSMARFAKMYLEGHLGALLNTWGSAGADRE